MSRIQKKTIISRHQAESLLLPLAIFLRIGGPSRYWRRVETAELSDALARKFSLFAKERSLIFLEELDDWLEAHRSKNRWEPKKRRRVGVGLFSIYSDPEVIDATA